MRGQRSVKGIEGTPDGRIVRAALGSGSAFKRVVRRSAHVALLSLGYYISGIVGTVLSLPPTGFAIIWPATSVLTAAFLLTPPRTWWIYLLGVLPAHVLLLQTFQTTPVPLAVALTQVGGNLTLAAATAFVVRRIENGPPRFDSFRGVFLFIALAGVLIPGVVNVVILSVHLLTGWTRDFWLAWRQWMLASIFPTVTITPLVVLTFRRTLLVGASRGALAELAALCAGLLAVSYFVFGAEAGDTYWPTLLLAPVPLMLWAAIRRGVGGACLALLAFAGAVMVQALHGAGPFAEHAAVASVVALQVFLTAASVPLLLLSALMEERERTQNLLRRSEERIEIAAASTDTGLWQWDERAGRVWMTEHCRTMFNLPTQVALTRESFLDVVHPDDRPHVRAALRTALAGPDVDGATEFRVQRGHDDVRWFIVQTHAEHDRSGALLRISGVFRDDTQRVLAQQKAEQLSQRILTLQDDERRSIAEDLHDSTGQHLTAAGLNLLTLRRKAGSSPEIRSLFDEIQSSLLQASNELRTFTYLLRPPELERHGLCGALTRYVNGFSRRTGVDAAVRLNPSADELPVEQQRAMLRITQESLANVHRHAAATRVTVALRRQADTLHLVVSDNGQGFRTGSAGRTGGPATLGVGIPGMTARIRQLGGRMVVRSGPKGTTVHVALPTIQVRDFSRMPEHQETAA